MSLIIPADDHGKFRVFSLSPELAVNADQDQLTHLFGSDGLKHEYVDIIVLEELDELGLIGYLKQGYGLDADAADRAALAGLTGTCLIIMSRATSGRDVFLHPIEGVTHVTTLGEAAVLTATPLEADTLGTLEPAKVKKPKSDARVGGMVATVALLFMFALVALMVWIGG